jgi:hypothetical protein
MDNSNENDKTLTMKTINPRVIEVEYAVRGPIVIRAAEIEKQIKQVWILLLLLLFKQIFFFSRVTISIHLIVLFERILEIVMLVVIKYQLLIFVKFVFVFCFH